MVSVFAISSFLVPLNPDYTTNETRHFVQDAEPKLMVTSSMGVDEQFQDKSIRQVISESNLHRDALKFEPELGVENVDPDDIACLGILY